MNTEQHVPQFRFKGFSDSWKQCTLGDLGSVEMNRRIFKEQTSEEGDVPFYKIGTFGGQPDAFITRDLFEEYKRKYSYPKVGDLLISASGSIGRIVEYTGKDEYFQDSNIVWLEHGSQLDNAFLKQFYLIAKWNGIEGTTIKRLYNKIILNTKIALPSLPEQKRIGLFLGKLDSTIALHQRKLAKLKELKKGYLQKLFPQNGEKVPELRFKEYSDAWEKRKLGDYAIIKGRLGWKSLKQDEYTNNPLDPSMIAGRHISNGIVNWSIVDHIPQWRYDESPEIALEEGDVIFSKDGSLGNPALINSLPNRATINSTMMMVRTNSKISSGFFFQILNSSQFQNLIRIKVSGSSIPHLFQADMTKFIFLAPSILEQQQLSNLLQINDDLIAATQHKLDMIKQLKEAFLGKMFC